MARNYSYQRTVPPRFTNQTCIKLYLYRIPNIEFHEISWNTLVLDKRKFNLTVIPFVNLNLAIIVKIKRSYIPCVLFLTGIKRTLSWACKKKRGFFGLQKKEYIHIVYECFIIIRYRKNIRIVPQAT